MEAVSISGMTVSFYQTTRRNVPENSHFHIRRDKNLKFHQQTVSPLSSDVTAHYKPWHSAELLAVF
jgi:hypothetical protein